MIEFFYFNYFIVFMVEKSDRIKFWTIAEGSLRPVTRNSRKFPLHFILADLAV